MIQSTTSGTIPKGEAMAILIPIAITTQVPGSLEMQVYVTIVALIIHLGSVNPLVENVIIAIKGTFQSFLSFQSKSVNSKSKPEQ